MTMDLSKELSYYLNLIKILMLLLHKNVKKFATELHCASGSIGKKTSVNYCRIWITLIKMDISGMTKLIKKCSETEN